MTERQRAFDWPIEPRFGRADFMVSDSNRAAFDYIERWPAWPVPAVVVFGPAASGKTHLAHLWCARAGAALLPGPAVADLAVEEWPSRVAVDDADRAPERTLLHLYNLCLEGGGAMLLTMRASPAAQPLALADLASRLRSLPAVGIAPPDDGLLGAVLMKHFADRQLRVAPGVLAYLAPRVERSFAAVRALAARLDRLASERGRPVTVGLARAVLAESPDQSLPPSDLTVT